MAHIVVVGAGMMGSAACVPLVDRGHNVRLVGSPLDRDIVASLRSTRTHPTLRARLPEPLQVFTADELPEALSGADAIVLGVSSLGIEWAAGALAEPLALSPCPVALLSKGLELDGSGLRVLTEVVSARLFEPSRVVCQPVSICGPCIAGELVRRVQTLAVFTGSDLELVRCFAAWFETPYYRPRVVADHRGAQLCAALKNAYAMGVGFASGLHERAGGERGSVAMHNYEAAVFAQAASEMGRWALALGGTADTALGLAGVGDLNVTCNGGRTGRFGALLGFGHPLAEAIRRMGGATLECLEILEVCDRFLRGPDSGVLRPSELPLLCHLIEVGLRGVPVAVPFEDFFRA